VYGAEIAAMCNEVTLTQVFLCAVHFTETVSQSVAAVTPGE